MSEQDIASSKDAHFLVNQLARVSSSLGVLDMSRETKEAIEWNLKCNAEAGKEPDYCLTEMDPRFLNEPNYDKIEWFQISPAFSYSEERQRVGQFLHSQVTDYLHKNVGYYRGGHPGALMDEFKAFKADEERYFHPCVIAISCHGRKDGYFRDCFLRKSFWWTPRRLWEGFDVPYGKDQSFRFVGLKELLQDHPFSSVTVLVTQCYGANFADELRKLVPKQLKVVGLSYGKTRRTVNHNSSTIGDLVFHQQTLAWLRDPTSFSPLPADSEDMNSDDIDKELMETLDDLMTN